MITVVGVTGMLGKAIAERLLRAGLPFRGACRDTTKAKSLADRGVEVVQIDLDSPSSIAAALAGSTKIISCIHGLLGRSRASIEEIDIGGQKALIDAAVELGVERYVFVSALGASPDHPSDFWRAKASTEQHLKSLGMDYVILRPSAFMDLYAHDLIGAAVIRKGWAVILGNGGMARDIVSVDDVAAAAVQALVREDVINQTFHIGSGESFTEREIAATYAALTGNRARYITVPPAALRVLAAAISPFHAGVGRLLRLPLQLNGREDLHLASLSGMARLEVDPVRLRAFASRRVRAVS